MYANEYIKQLTCFLNLQYYSGCKVYLKPWSTRITFYCGICFTQQFQEINS